MVSILNPPFCVCLTTVVLNLGYFLPCKIPSFSIKSKRSSLRSTITLGKFSRKFRRKTFLIHVVLSSRNVPGVSEAVTSHSRRTTSCCPTMELLFDAPFMSSAKSLPTMSSTRSLTDESTSFKFGEISIDDL